MIVAGLGFATNCPAGDILAAIRLAEEAGDKARIIAVADFKANEPGLTEAVKILILPVMLMTRTALEQAQPRCASHSEHALSAVGLGSVAEACALAAAGPASVLLVPRVSFGKATCAIAGAKP